MERQIHYGPCICIKDSTRKVQRKAIRFPHNIRRPGKGLRQSSHRFDMVGHEKEGDSRRVREGDTGHVQKN